MQWLSVKKYEPINDSICVVITPGGDVEVCCYTFDKNDDFGFLSKSTRKLVQDVTHFFVLEATELNHD